MKLKQKIIAKADNKFGNKNWYNSLKTDSLLRALVKSAFGTVITIFFAIYNGVLGISESSIWHGAWATYLIVLAIQRLLVILVYGIVYKKVRGSDERLERGKLKIYLANGAVFVPMTLILSVINALLLSARRPIVGGRISAIVAAAYAFYKITMAIINFARAKALKDPIVQTIRNSGLIDAIVSIILLESTLITTFGELNRNMLSVIAISGLLGCAFILALGIYMIIVGARGLHKTKI